MCVPSVTGPPSYYRYMCGTSSVLSVRQLTPPHATWPRLKVPLGKHTMQTLTPSSRHADCRNSTCNQMHIMSLASSFSLDMGSVEGS